MPSRAFLSTCLALCAAHVAAAPLVGGDFSAGLSGWNDTGSTGVADGRARLSTGTGTDPYSAVPAQGAALVRHRGLSARQTAQGDALAPHQSHHEKSP